MDAEERTHTAITITRTILQKALTSPFTMAVMAIDKMDPDAVEAQAYYILEYLEKTKPWMPEGMEDQWRKAVKRVKDQAKKDPGDSLDIDTIEEGV